MRWSFVPKYEYMLVEKVALQQLYFGQTIAWNK
jgi:hypothetical protein